MRERELENWGRLKSGDCHRRFRTPSKASSFFFLFFIGQFNLQKCLVYDLLQVSLLWCQSDVNFWTSVLQNKFLKGKLLFFYSVPMSIHR